ncbi:MAG TPA: MaoC family dehydratase N-terminal domain-containing protein [bacterium]|nr:MaoC family dehydratase N-terminal domain-containing protein [bacterium]
MDQLGALRQWIGPEWGPLKAPGPIEWSDVRRYLNAVGGQSPAARAAHAQGSSSGSGITIPPAMILDVLRPAPGMEGYADADGGLPSSGGPVALIQVPGERLRLNVSTEIEWMRPPRIGDWVSVQYKIIDIAVKERRDGSAVYITEERRYTDQAGQPLALVRQTMARFLEDDATASGPGRSRVESSGG